MLQVTIPAREWLNEKTGEFIYLKETTLRLEHSLISISKWESKWKVPYLDETAQLTYEQLIDYIRCMTINNDVDPMVYYSIPQSIMQKIEDYTNDKMTATWFTEDKVPKKTGFKMKGMQEKVTSELIYYWMIEAGIPMECERWHINRLMTLLRVCSVKRSKPEKKTKKQSAMDRAALNRARLQKYKTKG